MANHTPRTFNVTSKPAAPAAPATSVPPLAVVNEKGKAKFYDFESSNPDVIAKWDAWVECRAELHELPLYKKEAALREDLLTACKADLMGSKNPTLIATRQAHPMLEFVVSLQFGKLAFAMVEAAKTVAKKAKLVT